MSDGTINIPVRSAPPSSPTTGRSKIWVSDSDKKPRVTDDNGITSSFESIYGSEYQSDVNDILATNNTTTFQSYLNLPYTITDVTVSSTYEVEVNFIWNYSSGSTDFRGQILINNVQYKEDFRNEPKDGGTDQRFWNGFKYRVGGDELSLLSGNITWAFAASSGGNTARMYYCYLSIKRVS